VNVKEERGGYMSVKTFLTTFTVIFLAEIFDKTELAVISLAIKEKSKISVFWGAVLALSLTTLLAILIGNLLTKLINPKIIRYISGSVFIAVGVLIFLRYL